MSLPSFARFLTYFDDHPKSGYHHRNSITGDAPAVESRFQKAKLMLYNELSFNGISHLNRMAK
jgi:hypothetical protein